MDFGKLQDEITEIIIFGWFHTYDSYVPKRTAEDYNSVEKRMIDAYRNDPRFNALTRNQVALIMRSIQEHLKDEK